MTTSAAARRDHERRAKQRGIAVAGLSTAAILTAVIVLVPLAPGWPAVKKSFFNGEVFAKTFPGLFDAFLLDLAIFAWSAPIIAIFALAIALARDTRAPGLFPLRAAAAIYTDIFRGVPVVLTVYLIGFGVPGLGLDRPWNSPYLWGTVALVLTYSAYVAEIIRSGIGAVHRSQRAAAASLGLTEADAMRYVVLPQALRHVAPANMNMLIALQKDVALLSFIGPVEVLRQAGVYKSLMANFTPYVGAALLFLAVTVPATRLADYWMARQSAARR